MCRVNRIETEGHLTDWGNEWSFFRLFLLTIIIVVRNREGERDIQASHGIIRTKLNWWLYRQMYLWINTEWSKLLTFMDLEAAIKYGKSNKFNTGHVWMICWGGTLLIDFPVRHLSMLNVINRVELFIPEIQLINLIWRGLLLSHYLHLFCYFTWH